MLVCHLSFQCLSGALLLSSHLIISPQASDFEGRVCRTCTVIRPMVRRTIYCRKRLRYLFGWTQSVQVTSELNCRGFHDPC
ncbi:hypothetical protein EDD85DRAFT_846661 [Armillaria nabsnona]|nr:hypothetical protein EDD85DRAFT_846661 [Armillaria nabsnona]